MSEARAPGPIASLYVHAPFCARRCCYCDFAVAVDRSPDTGRWLGAIRAELHRSRAPPFADALETVYVGGGTPSLLDPSFARALAEAVGRERLRSPALEWTVEANPESFSRRTAREWAAAGVNRVSFGVQSFDAAALGWMGRLHAPDDAEAAVGIARGAGLENLSVDLILGLPPEVSRCWERDIERALGLGVPHISLYGLTVEEGAPLARMIREGRAMSPDETRYRDEYLFAARTLTRAGYDHYEVSSFARPGHASRHNRAYWSGAPYRGVGNGAHSYWGGRRRWNRRDWRAYERKVMATGSGRAGSELLTVEQKRLEGAWLALRTSSGIEVAGHDVAGRAARGVRGGAAPVRRVVESWRSRGLARVEDGRARLTPEGWLLLDDLALELDAVLAADPTRRPSARPREVRPRLHPGRSHPGDRPGPP